MLIEQLVFYAASALVVFAGVMMITSRNPVPSALYLVLAFVGSAALWILLEAEFLGLILIFVYVGAVMTLFLFVVMMLNLDVKHLKRNFVKHLPIAALTVAGMVGLMIFVLSPGHFGLMIPAHHGPFYSNLKELGDVLYTEYALAFEVAAIILLVAIVAAISLSHLGKTKRRVQDINRQINIRRDEAVRLVNMPSSPKPKGEEN